MKHVIPNRIDELWKKGVLVFLAKKLDITRVLTTKEQVTANTNTANVASAVVVGDLINNLKGFIPIVDSTGRITGYKTQAGADTVFPFSSIAEIAFDQETSNGYQLQGYSNDGGRTWTYNTIRGATTLNTKYGQLIRNSDTVKKYKFTSDRTAMFIGSFDSVFTPTAYKSGTIIPPTYGYTAGGLLVIVFG